MAHILIADDQRSIANLWARGFRQLGYTVDIVHNGSETIAYLRNNPLPKILLLDQMMPYGNGMDVIRQMTTLDPQHHIKVFFITAEPEVYHTEAVKYAVRVMYKPILFRNLQDEVESILRDDAIII